MVLFEGHKRASPVLRLAPACGVAWAHSCGPRLLQPGSQVFVPACQREWGSPSAAAALYPTRWSSSRKTGRVDR
jgi:hypothetical protein